MTRWVLLLLALGVNPAVAANAHPPSPTTFDCTAPAREPFQAPGPKVRMPADPVLAAITRDGNPQTLREAIRGTAVDMPRGSTGTTALMYAASANNWAAVDVLLESGADINLAAPNGETAIERAVALLRGSMACYLLAKGASVPAPSPTRAYLLPAAAASQPADSASALIAALLDAGYDIDARLPPAEHTALQIAAQSGNLPLVRLLVKRGARVDLVTPQGESAATLARRAGHIQIERTLRQAARSLR